jgi:hypothetical protein
LAALEHTSVVCPFDRSASAPEFLTQTDERRRTNLRESECTPPFTLIELGDHAKERTEAIDRQRKVFRRAHRERERRLESTDESLQPTVAVDLFEQLENNGNEIDTNPVDNDPELNLEPISLIVARTPQMRN